MGAGSSPQSNRKLSTFYSPRRLAKAISSDDLGVRLLFEFLGVRGADPISNRVILILQPWQDT